MMNVPLNISTLLERAEKYFAKKKVISNTATGIQRFTYKEIGERTRKLSSMLSKLGVNEGERVGTLAMNHHRHLEAYFAIPGIGAVLHTINLRLSPEHLIYIMNHAEDKVLLFDEMLLPLIEKLHSQLKTIEMYIMMTDHELPNSTIPNLYSYEQLLQEGDSEFQFKKDIDENSPAGMCYTSATTGNPKGVVYTHRSTVLHSMAAGLTDTLGLSEKDICLPVVPMFHVNAWGLPFAATWFGASQVLPGMFTPQSLASLIEKERVTITAGVPTIWLGLLKELEANQYDTSSLRAIVCGGSAAPLGMIKTFEEKFNIPFLHAYGMTETSPIATVSRLKSYQDSLSSEEKLNIRAKQGLLAPGLEMKVIKEDGMEVAWNGEEMGELLLRGPWIAKEYYNDDRSSESFKDGWLHTGDVATVDEEGVLKLVDRTKDLIKSGGEWISSVDLENALMAHDAIFEAAVISVPHKEWQERPIACVVLKEGQTTSKEDLNSYLSAQFAKWWLPDDIIVMKEIPKSSVGKFLKRTLREQFKNHLQNI